MIIDADGEDCWIPRDGWADYRTRSREELIERIALVLPGWAVQDSERR